jgi:transcriptional regulator with XRE-family HTH domain
MDCRPQENLRRLMSREGATIEELAQRSGVDVRSIRGILQGANRPHARTLHRLAEALGVDADEFFVDPARLLYRRFDRQTNPRVDEAIEGRPDLFEGWTEADFDELHSRVGTGGPLTLEGTLAAVEAMNRNRRLHEKLAVLLESSQADLIGEMIDLFYGKLMGDGQARNPANEE